VFARPKMCLDYGTLMPTAAVVVLLDSVTEVTVAHASARIGEAADTWTGGVISRANAAAAAQGYRTGQSFRAVVEQRLG
jgi:hypothetical protein